MDAKLKELIEQIKTEGIKAAEEEASRIVSDAEKKAQGILTAAKAEAAGMVERAQRDTDQRVQSGNEALRQSARDLILNVEKQLQKIFSSVVQKETKTAYSPGVLEDAIVAVVKSWNGGNAGEMSVQLPPDTAEKLNAGLRARLADELRKGLELRASPGLKSGFRFGEKNGSSYFDFSADSIAEALSAYLNPKLADLVRETVGKE